MQKHFRHIVLHIGRLLVFFIVMVIASPVEAGLNIVSVLRGSSPNGSIDGFIRSNGSQFAGANFGSASTVARNGATFTAAGTSGNPSGANWSTVGASVDSSLGGYAVIDPLFFSEIYGASPVTLTVSNLNPSTVYVVQIFHGEPRSCCAGNFTTNDFITDAGSVLPVPAFALGNAIAGETPPNFLDRAIVQVELTGITSFTYRMKDGVSRGPSIAGFQVRTVGIYTFFTDSTTNVVDAITLILNNPATAVVGDSGSNTRLTITNGGIVNGTYGQIGLTAGSTNNVAVVTGANSMWTNVFNLLVGLQGSFNTLQITNGGKADNNLGIIGFGPTASNNLVVVSGTNSVWNNRSDLTVGNSGPLNTLLVNNGGVVSNASGWIGNGSGASKNTVTVSGTNSAWVNTSNLVVGFDGSLSSLLITNWGTVTAGGVIVGMGSPVSANNRLTVQGGALRATNLSLTAVLDVRRGTNVLNGGVIEADQLMVTNVEGFFEFNGGTLITRGVNINTGNGLGFLVGAKPGFSPAIWDVRSNASPTSIPDGLLLGNTGVIASVLITNGATLSSSSTFIGSSPGAANNALLISGPNSACNTVASFFVGQYGLFNTLLITNGGTARSGIGVIGVNPDADYNTVTVSGLNSIWKNGGELKVGSFGSFNKLLINNGGGVSNTLGWIGYFTGANSNTVVVSGTNSSWNNSGNLTVGSSGSFNTLLVTNGGTSRDGSGYIGYNSAGGGNSVAVSGTNSSWNNSGDLFVGTFGSFNSLLLTNGGMATATVGAIGVAAGSGSNSVVVVGTNSAWNIADLLIVGNSGSSNLLLITQGGVVSNSSGSLGFYPESSGNQVTVAGGGSAWLNGDLLIVGSEGPRNTLLATNGGAVIAANLIVGEIASSTNNLLIVDGGALSVTNNAGSGALDIRRGTNRFNAGLITVDRLLMTNSLGRFSFNGGTLNARSASVANGAQFIVGNGSSVASYRLSGQVADSYSFANGLRVSANATLAGSGTIGGTLTVASAGTLSPGFSIGKIILNNSPSLQGSVIMEISKTGGSLTNDQVQCLGSLAYGGALTVSNLGPAALAAGDSFPLFNASSYSGAFSSLVLPTLSAGLTWTNRLLVNGTIAVVAVSPPRIAGVALSGTNLIFSVTNGVSGGIWDLLTSTNVALPILSWSTARSGNFDSQGVVNLTNGIIIGEPQRYFQIRTP